MIIENINNMQNNNGENRNRINYQKIKYISQKIFFFIVIFLHIFLITYKLYINNNTINFKKKKSLFNNDEPLFKDNIYNDKRNLDFNANNNNSIEDEIKEQMNKNYLFLVNLTSNSYKGKWTQFSFQKNDFFDEKMDPIFFSKK